MIIFAKVIKKAILQVIAFNFGVCYNTTYYLNSNSIKLSMNTFLFDRSRMRRLILSLLVLVSFITLDATPGTFFSSIGLEDITAIQDAITSMTQHADKLNWMETKLETFSGKLPDVLAAEAVVEAVGTPHDYLKEET